MALVQFKTDWDYVKEAIETNTDDGKEIMRWVASPKRGVEDHFTCQICASLNALNQKGHRGLGMEHSTDMVFKALKSTISVLAIEVQLP